MMADTAILTHDVSKSSDRPVQIAYTALQVSHGAVSPNPTRPVSVGPSLLLTAVVVAGAVAAALCSLT